MTKIAPGGLAEQDGRLRLGDKLLSVSGYLEHAGIQSLKHLEDIRTMYLYCQDFSKWFHSVANVLPFRRSPVLMQLLFNTCPYPAPPKPSTPRHTNMFYSYLKLLQY